MATRIDRHGTKLTNLNLWLDCEDVAQLTQEAGRLSSAEGKRVNLLQVIRAALRKAADEARQRAQQTRP